MQKLDPKVVWLFFIQFFFTGLIFFLIINSWLVPFVFGTRMVTNGNIVEWERATEPEDVASMIVKVVFIYLVLFILYIIFCWIWAKLSYHYYGYEVADDAFKKESGVIWKKYVSIPYERIQNVDIYRGVFARILRLSDLNIQTAGNSGVYYGRGIARGINAEGRLPGMNKEKAEQLRDELIKRAKGAKQGL